MARHSLLKLLSLVPVLLGITLIAFLLGVLSPGDPAEIALAGGSSNNYTQAQLEELRERLGLNDPLPVQYVRWLKNAIHGDLGQSYSTDRDVGSELLRRIPVTLRLSVWAMLFACTGGIGLGMLAAAFRGRTADRIIRLITNLMLSLPSFWIAILLVLLFSETLRWLPTSGVGGFKHMILPAAVLSCVSSATTARLMRASLLSEFGKQYYIAARAKGIGGRALVGKNAMPNAILPVVTQLGNYLGGILGGSVVVETVFALPGIGSYAVNAIYARDYPALQGYVLLAGLMYVIVTLIVDIMGALINPKIRLGGKAA